MNISYIVCTLNRADSLKLTLDSILASVERESRSKSEIVIVDNGSTDDSDMIVEQFRSTKRCAVILVQESRRGLCFARNAGMQAASGEILAFVDDDCRVSDFHTTEVLDHYLNDQALVVRGGRIELGDPADLPITVKLDKNRTRLESTMYPGGFVHGANMTFHRSVIEKIGNFDTRFGAGATFKAADDADFLYRAHTAGIEIEYVPDMMIRHYHGRRDFPSALRLHDDYDFGDGALYAKHLFNHPSVLRFPFRSLSRFSKQMIGIKVPHNALGRGYGKTVRYNWRGFAKYFAISISSKFRTKNKIISYIII